MAFNRDRDTMCVVTCGLCGQEWPLLYWVGTWHELPQLYCVCSGAPYALERHWKVVAEKKEA